MAFRPGRAWESTPVWPAANLVYHVPDGLCSVLRRRAQHRLVELFARVLRELHKLVFGEALVALKALFAVCANEAKPCRPGVVPGVRV